MHGREENKRYTQLSATSLEKSGERYFPKKIPTIVEQRRLYLPRWR
jgi:hypothetical protein